MQRALAFLPFNPPASGDSRWLTNGSPMAHRCAVSRTGETTLASAVGEYLGRVAVRGVQRMCTAWCCSLVLAATCPEEVDLAEGTVVSRLFQRFPWLYI